MGKNTVEVFVRTRPTIKFGHDSLQIDVEKGLIHAHAQRARGAGVDNSPGDWSFRLDRILHNSSQEEVYDAVARDLVHSVLDGYHSTLLAYGQTGAGKTFTINGGTNSYKYRGLAPRSIAQIYREVAAKPELDVIVRVSYLEIYNETFYDLLADASLKDLAVMEDASGSLVVKGLKKEVAVNEEEALNLLFLGDTNRAVGEHVLNKQSSRSHTIFTVYLEMRSRVESSEKVVMSKLNLVDLAGSERVKKTDSRGDTLREAQHINKSLSFLEQVVIALSSRNREHIPFRSSKLTNVLRDSLGGNCRTRLIANIWPETRHFEETVSTLKFATRMMRVTTNATKNIELDPTLLIKKYEKEIRDLKQELAMHDALANRGAISYDDFTPEEQYALGQKVRQYVRDEIDEIDVVNLKQVHELFRQFKLMVRNLKEDLRQGRSTQSKPEAVENTQETSNDAKKAEGGKNDPEQEDENEKEDMVGVLDDTAGGFNVGGTAPADARPPTGNLWMQRSPSPGPGPATSRAGRSLSPVEKMRTSPVPVNENDVTDARSSALLEDFKFGEGKSINQEYNKRKNELKAKRQKLRQLSLRVNSTKQGIDVATSELENVRLELRNSSIQDEMNGAEVIDEEEYKLIQKLRQLKSSYQELFHQWKVAKSEYEFAKKITEQCKMQHAHEYLHWLQGHRATLNDDDVLDDAERFEKMETNRILETDPDSLSFHNARKKARDATRGKRNRRTNPSRVTTAQ